MFNIVISTFTLKNEEEYLLRTEASRNEDKLFVRFSIGWMLTVRTHVTFYIKKLLPFWQLWRNCASTSSAIAAAAAGPVCPARGSGCLHVVEAHGSNWHEGTRPCLIGLSWCRQRSLCLFVPIGVEAAGSGARAPARLHLLRQRPWRQPNPNANSRTMAWRIQPSATTTHTRAKAAAALTVYFLTFHTS